MSFILFVLAGAIGGVLGGMGMGGGTVLIPLLTIFYGVNQHVAQAVNLISFIPMAIVAVIIHIRNGLVDFKPVFLTVLSGVLFCVLGSLIARGIDGGVLKRLFGAFLLLLSVFQFFSAIKSGKK